MRNVLLVVLDCVRADHVGRETTPALAALAADARAYREARAPGNWSLPSHASMFTGLFPDEHGVTTADDAVRPGRGVFAELGREGYATGAFSENVFLTEDRYGLAPAFDTVVPQPDPGAFPDADAHPGDRAGPTGFHYADRFLEWAEGESRWAAVLNVMDAHRPYVPLAAYDDWSAPGDRDVQSALPLKWEWGFHDGIRGADTRDALRRLYRGAVRQTDAVLAHVLGGLADRGLREDTLVVVCSDHGEGFGEPGDGPGEPDSWAHGIGLAEPLVHVPLVVDAPGDPGGVVDEPASLARLPAALRTGAAGEFDPDALTRGPVRAVGSALNEEMYDACRERVADTAPFTARGVASYESTGDGVVKFTSWGGRTGAVRLDGDARPVVDRQPADPEALAHAGGRELAAAAARAVDDDVAQRLEGLGYR